MHPRNADNIDNLNRSVEYIKEFFVSSGARVTAQGVPIGYYDSAPGSRDYPYPQCPRFIPIGDFIASVGRILGYQRRSSGKNGIVIIPDLSVYSMNAPWFIPGIDFSDHLNYWQHDIPAVMITDTAFYRNKQYHLPGDTADRLKLSENGSDGVITLLHNSK